MTKEKEKLLLGWEEWASLPALGIPAIKAKIDTGAKTSALHAFSVEPYRSKGGERVRFDICPLPDRPDIVIHCTAKLLGQRSITSSNGETEIRYIIKTNLRINDQEWPIEISLSNRESMQYRMLLGRQALKSAIVNPVLSHVQGQGSPKVYDTYEKPASKRKKLRIAILSVERNNYSTKSLVAAAEKRGHHVDVLNTTRCYMDLNARGAEIYYDGEPLHTYDAVIPRIGSSITFYGLAVVRQFEAIGTYCLNSSFAIGTARDKLNTHQILAYNRIGMPSTGFAHHPLDTKELIDIVGGTPIVVKLLEGTQGKGVVLAETKKAAESVVGAFRDIDANILVQEFISEAAGRDIRCLVIGGKVIAAMERRAAEDEFRSNLHRGGSAEPIKITKEERDMAIKSARVLGLNVAGVDIIRAHDGPKVLEVNSSPGLQGIETSTGIDVAGCIIEYIEKKAYSSTARSKRLKKKATAKTASKTSSKKAAPKKDADKKSAAKKTATKTTSRKKA